MMHSCKSKQNPSCHSNAGADALAWEETPESNSIVGTHSGLCAGQCRL